MNQQWIIDDTVEFPGVDEEILFPEKEIIYGND
jgi:hypothetical protein